MKNLFFLIFSMLVVVIISCNRKACGDNVVKSNHDKSIPELPRFQKKLVDSDTLTLNTDTLLYYQKSACFGFCPTFNYTIYQNGMIRYDGLQHVEPLGTEYSLVTDAWWNEVLQQIQKSNFFELANVYPLEEKMYIPDLPNTIIVIKEFGKRKSITDNHNAPKELKDFELFLEEKFKQINFDEFKNTK